MAHIDRRRDRRKKWRARYRGPDGKERSQSFERRVDAERWLATQTADVARGAWVDPTLGRMTFADWSKVWQAGLHHLRPRVRELNLAVLRNHLIPRFGSHPLARITTADVRTMVAEDIDAGLSASAVRRRVFVLSSILKAAVVDGRIARNPCEGVHLPSESARPMRVLEPNQVLELADAIRPAHYRPLILTAAYVGPRWGELAALSVEHVDILRRTLRIERALVEANTGRPTFGPPKSKAGVRTVTMPAAIAELLAEHIGTAPVQSSGLVFPTVTGQPMRRGNFRTVWRRAIAGTEKHPGVFRGTELENLVFHELRHTAAALAIAAGAHPLTIRDRLGHSSITVTMDTYGHLFPAQDQALAEALDGMLTRSMIDSRADQPRTSTDQVVRLRRSAP